MSMPRLSFEEPKGGPLAKAAQAREAQEPAGAEHLADLFVEEPVEGGKHRRPHRRDTVLVVLRAATVAVAIALVGAVILLTTSGADDGTRAPALPEISDSNEPHTGPTTTTPPAAFVAPEVRTQTTAIVQTTTTTTQQPSVPGNQPPTAPGQQFVRIGDKCDTPGAYAFTERFEPVVCDRRRGNDQLVWRPMFR
jgi:hypothetical protein